MSVRSAASVMASVSGVKRTRMGENEKVRIPAPKIRDSLSRPGPSCIPFDFPFDIPFDIPFDVLFDDLPVSPSADGAVWNDEGDAEAPEDTCCAEDLLTSESSNSVNRAH